MRNTTLHYFLNPTKVRHFPSRTPLYNMRTFYLWALGWGICVIGAEHHTRMHHSLYNKSDPNMGRYETCSQTRGKGRGPLSGPDCSWAGERTLVESIMHAGSILIEQGCYICSPPCSHAVCCHGRFPQCCSDGAYCYCCED